MHPLSTPYDVGMHDGDQLALSRNERGVAGRVELPEQWRTSRSRRSTSGFRVRTRRTDRYERRHIVSQWVVAVSRFEQSVGVPSPYLPIAWTPPSSNTPWVTTSITQSFRHRDLSKHGDKNRSTTHPTSPDSVSLFWNDRDLAATVDTFTRGIPDIPHERPMSPGDWWRGNADTLARPDRGPRQVDQKNRKKKLVTNPPHRSKVPRASLVGRRPRGTADQDQWMH